MTNIGVEAGVDSRGPQPFGFREYEERIAFV